MPHDDLLGFLIYKIILLDSIFEIEKEKRQNFPEETL